MYLLFKNPTKPRARIDDRIRFGSGFRYRNFRSVPFPQFLPRLKSALGTSCHLFPHLSSSVRRDLAYLRQIISGLCVTYGQTHTHTHPQIRENVSNFGLDIRATPGPSTEENCDSTGENCFRPVHHQLNYVQAEADSAHVREYLQRRVGASCILRRDHLSRQHICALIEKILTE